MEAMFHPRSLAKPREPHEAEAMIPSHRKTQHGPDVVDLADLNHMRSRHPHFHAWPNQLERRSSSVSDGSGEDVYLRSVELKQRRIQNGQNNPDLLANIDTNLGLPQSSGP